MQDSQSQDWQPQDWQSQDSRPQDWQSGEEPRGGGRDERQQHPEDRGPSRGQTREQRQQRQARWQESLPELVARLETQGTEASARSGDQLSNIGPADGSAMQDSQPQDSQPQDSQPQDWQPQDSQSQDWQSQDGQPQDWQPGEEPRGGGRDERQQHPEDRGPSRGQTREQRQARWQESFRLAPDERTRPGVPT